MFSSFNNHTAGSDFTGEPNSMVVGPTERNPLAMSSLTFHPPFEIVDDKVNENEERFYLIAEVGPDVPKDVVCFLREAGDTTCHGQVGAAQIDIIDNDGKYMIVIRQQASYLHLI